MRVHFAYMLFMFVVTASLCEGMQRIDEPSSCSYQDDLADLLRAIEIRSFNSALTAIKKKPALKAYIFDALLESELKESEKNILARELIFLAAEQEKLDCAPAMREDIFKTLDADLVEAMVPGYTSTRQATTVDTTQYLHKPAVSPDLPNLSPRLWEEVFQTGMKSLLFFVYVCMVIFKKTKNLMRES